MRDPFDMNFNNEYEQHQREELLSYNSFIQKDGLWYHIYGIAGNCDEKNVYEPRIKRWFQSLIFLDNYVSSYERTTFTVYDGSMGGQSASVIIKGQTGNGRLADNTNVSVIARKDSRGSFIARRVYKLDSSNSVYIVKSRPWYFVWIVTALIGIVIFSVIHEIANLISLLSQIPLGNIILGFIVAVLIIVFLVVMLLKGIFGGRRRFLRRMNRNR